MSDTNRVALRYTEENVASLGSTPATPPFTVLPFAGAPNLGFTPETVVSNLIRDDRQVTDLILVGGQGDGDANSELAFGFHDDLFQASWFSTWQARYSRRNDKGATQITNVDGTAEEFDVTDEGDAPVVDDIVLAEGFTNAANNGFHIVTGTTGNIAIAVAGSNLVDETPPATATLHVVGRQAATGDIVAGTSPNTLSSTVLDFTTLGLQPGDWIKIAGFSSTTANNDWVRILTISTNVITLDLVPSGWGVDAGAGDDVQLYMGERLVNGTLRRAFTLEKEYTDHTPASFEYQRGMLHDSLVVTASAQSIVTAGHTFLGIGNNGVDDVFSTSRIAGATTIAAPSTSVLNSSSNVARIARGGTQIAGLNFVTEFSFTIGNNLRTKPAVGFIGPADIGAGEFNVTGTLSSYFDSTAIAQDVVANTETSVDVRFMDAAGHVLLFDAPRIKYSEGRPEIPGKNDDVIINPNWQAIRDNVFGYTLKAMRFYGTQ